MDWTPPHRLADCTDRRNAQIPTTTKQPQEVGIDHTPSNAVGILCQPRAVKPGEPFVINIWFTQTHPRESDLIAVALVSQ